jgi:hypothetical protein
MKILKPKKRTVTFKNATARPQYNEYIGKKILPDLFTPGPRYGKVVDLYRGGSKSVS